MVITRNDENNETENNSRGSGMLVHDETLNSRVRAGVSFTPMSDETILPAVPTDPFNAALGASQRSRRINVVHPSHRDPVIDENRRRVAELARMDLANCPIHELTSINRLNVPPPGSGISLREVDQTFEIFMKYSLNIYNFPPCPEEDLMLAVYFFLEEKLNAKLRIWECAKYKVHRNEQYQEQVGVIFYRVQSVDLVLRRAEIVLKESVIKIKPNTNRELIYLAIRRRIPLPRLNELPTV